jgi:hypothetical protein
MNVDLDQQLKAIELFQDWSNVLLATTTIALGWVAGEASFRNRVLRAACVALLTLSICFGVVTLALLPIIAGQLRFGGVRTVTELDAKKRQSDPAAAPWSFYDQQAGFRVLGESTATRWLRVKHVCWFQHAFFLAGIVVYAIGTVRKPREEQPNQAGFAAG